MTPPQAVATDRVEAHRREALQRLLRSNNSVLAEVVARHYLSVGHMAAQLYALANQHRINPSATTEETLRLMLGKIQKDHTETLGMEPSWEKLI